MALKYYHAEPLANSLKSMVPLKEKGLDYESVYVDLHKFEQHSEWFTAINPEGQVPVLDHDGVIITHTLKTSFPMPNLPMRRCVHAMRWARRGCAIGTSLSTNT